MLASRLVDGFHDEVGSTTTGWTALHPNRRLLAPLWHGDGCEGLSSLFAIVNGIRLAVADRTRLTAPQVHALMQAGLRFIDGRLTTRQLVLGGVRVQLWRQLAEGLAHTAERLTGIRIAAERLHVAQPSSRVAVVDSLVEALAARRVPLVLFKGGHYTVISGVTASNILLFDSAGSCWVAKHTCRVPGGNGKARHVLCPAAFIALAA